MIPLEGALVAALIALTLAVSLGVLRRLDHTERRWREILEARFVLGVPWGSLVVIAFVLAVYLFVQDGISDFENPVVFPYRAWSYSYPLGMVTAPFSHASSGHLIGNLTGTIVVAPIAEYAWGHYTDREDGRLAPLTTNPWLRALVTFPLAVVTVGILTGIFAFGPVIGFSGVVFAFAGFAIVRYPITTLVAAVGAHGVVSTVYRAIQSPILEVAPQASPPSAPSWATVAIQGHALGFFLGFLLAVALCYRRGHRPNPLHLWVALVIYGFSKGLWMIYWFGPENTYVLFRAPGVLVVFALALVVTLAVTASERPALPPRIRERLPGGPTESERRLERALEIGASGGAATSRRIRELAVGPRDERLADIGRQQAALAAVLIVLALIAGPAIPANAVTVDDATLGEGNSSLTVEGYTISYAEGVENEMVSVVDVPAFGGGTVEASGVIVSSTERHIWFQKVSKNQLAFTGEETIYLGGPGWREAVHVEREGWSAVGNDTAYMVWLSADDEDRQLAHTSEPVTADVRIDGQNVTVVPAADGFSLEVAGEEITTVDLPGENESVEAGGLTLERTDDAIYASSNGTYVQVASKETYN